MSKVKRTQLDKFIGYFSPQTEVRRLMGRAKVEYLAGQRRYEAGTKSRRTSGWLGNGTSANATNAPYIKRLRENARDAVRNNPYCANALDTVVSNTVGTGILASFSGLPESKLDVLKERWKEWTESTDCDADGELTFSGLQALVWRSIYEAGEVFVRKRTRRSSDGLPVPLQIQLIESDMLDAGHHELLANGNEVKSGIEFNRIGKRVAYHFYKTHPGEVSSFTSSLEKVRVSADEIEHLFFKTRIGQVRGVSHLAPALVRLNDLDDYEHAEQVKKKMVASMMGFIRDMGVEELEDDEFEFEAESFEPGEILRLPAGKDITFNNTPSDHNYSPYIDTQLHAVCSGLRMPYEAVTGDYSKVNFSSGRMGWIEFHRKIEMWRWILLVPRFCDPIFKWFQEAALLSFGDISEAKVSWTPPRREMIDPTKEIAAMKEAVRAGLTSLPEAQRELGYDPETLIAEIEKSFLELRQKGIVLDSDPNQTSQNGNLHEQPDSEVGRNEKN